MQLVLTGIHQRTTPVALREQLAFDQSNLAAALAALRAQAHEAMILSTCNRVEIIAWMDDQADPAQLATFLTGWHGLQPEDIAPHIFTRTGEAAVHHLFRLAAGLDSMVLGEEQIMSQLKEAAQAATDAGALGPALRRLIDGALSAGKLVRSKTGIARLNLSVVSVAVDLARRANGGLGDQRVLIVGAGRMAELALKHLHARAGSLLVTSRSPERAAALAVRFGVRSAAIADLPALIAASDVVFSCTSCSTPIIDREMAAQAAAGRAVPLTLIDLAVPRDIAPEVAIIPQVLLFDVDAMRVICESNRAARAAEVSAAEQLVTGEVEKFEQWLASQKAVPTIRALRERAEQIRAGELERTLARLPNLGQREQELIGALSAAIVNKLLHQPISALKNPREAEEMMLAAQRLFQL
ncbi:MAG: glutamyl-tRNA reductase [Roseiflexaceae bacterium]|nr:glutamyl-tRNA reductase [Roseiflexaceae bacterium]